jgi:hypothetical protein
MIHEISLSFSFLLLSYLFSMSSQSFIFVQAQNLTNVTQANISDSMIYIPPTISKGAQDILKSLTTNLPTFVTPSSDDLRGWQELNYGLARFSKWNQTTDQVVSVIKDQGYSLDNIAMYGDSAGGGLIAGSVLKMRDEGVGLPAALVLWSPWTDLTGIGDTYFTLKNAEPFLSVDSMLKNMADAYANPSDQKNQYVSAAYGNFSNGFPPTLIQGGTKEMLLSDFVRLYQALDLAGVPVKLDIYEGMPHAFQTFFHNTTESNIAISKTNDFLKEYLNY